MVKSNETELERIEEDKENASKIEKGDKASQNNINEQGQLTSEKGAPSSNKDEEQEHGNYNWCSE